MVPCHIDPTVVASERRVFEALRTAGVGENWTVLHSLGLSSDWAGEFGEIDFVVVLPGVGIVCLEVKGGGIALNDGVWTTRNRYGATERLKKSPYRQAQDGQWKLLSALRAKYGQASLEARCPMGWLVVFPDIVCPPVTSEAARGETIDRDDLEKDIGIRLTRAPSLLRLSARTDLVPPTPPTCSRILSFLRPSFDRIPAPASEDWDADSRLKTLTEEQFEALDNLADNRLSLLRGPAGTGKTLIGIESARRAALGGRSVLVACFNAALGGWLQGATEGFGPGRVIVGHLHGLLRERIMASPLAGDLERAERSHMPSEELFGRLYYELGALAIEESHERFDTIVFDEVQDLPSRSLAEIVTAWLRSGAEARVLLLGDFTRQALYAGSSNASVELIRETLGPVAVFNLRLNCRNTRRIATQTGILSGFGDHKLSDRQPEGDQVSLMFYVDVASGLAALDLVVRRLRETGCKASDVIVLGSRRRESSLVAGRTSVGGWPLRSLSEARAGDLAYSTAHAFKGLERRVVIVIDAEATSPDESDALLYVAMSRARLRLFVLAPETARPVLQDRMSTAALAAFGRKVS